MQAPAHHGSEPSVAPLSGQDPENRARAVDDREPAAASAAARCDTPSLGSAGMAWSIEQVVAIAPSPARFAAADAIATPSRWVALGADDAAVWGRCRGSGREPYETMVDHAHLAWRCTCPSRSHPCKHALALLVMWVKGQVPAGVATPGDARVGRRARPARGARPRRHRDHRPRPTPARVRRRAAAGARASERDLDGQRDERIARLQAGLVELDRWLDDRLRTGLADPALARYATWDDLAARLVDARRRRARQPRPAARRRRRRPARLARGRARRARRAAPPRRGRPARARAARRPRRHRRHGVRLAGPPGRRAGRRARHRHVGRRRPQRHARGPHRGAPHVAARAGRRGRGRWCCRSPPTARRSTRRSSSATRSPPTSTATRAARGGPSSARATTSRSGDAGRAAGVRRRRGMRRGRHGARRRAVARPRAGHARRHADVRRPGAGC